MITVIGMDGSPLSEPAASALAGATLVVGARRHLAAVDVPQGARTVELGELRPALDVLGAHEGDAAVLASGDPGFFGVVRSLRRRGLAAAVLPAVSSVALAFARAGLCWDDATVVSAHGRDLRRALNVCRAYPKVAVLTGPGAGPAEIASGLAGWQRQLIVCERLGGPDERITGCSPASATGQAWKSPNTVLVLAGTPGSPDVIKDLVGLQPPQILDHDPKASHISPIDHSGHDGNSSNWVGAESGTPGLGWAWPPSRTAGGWALAEDRFDTRDAVITKAEVRALALARLAPGPGMLVWDVGSGTGSVAVECARFGAAVIAVERDERRCELIRRNARRYGVDVRVVSGDAPGSLAGLPDPDAVFVGGGGPLVVEAVAARRPARIVVALAAIERAGQAHAALASDGYDVDGALVQAARFAPLPGDLHRLSSTNPVFLLWATPAAVAAPPVVASPAGHREEPG